jgi:hypothetical protein
LERERVEFKTAPFIVASWASMEASSLEAFTVELEVEVVVVVVVVEEEVLVLV